MSARAEYTPASMRTCFNRGTRHTPGASTSGTRRQWDGKTWQPVDRQAAMTLAWLRATAEAQAVHSLTHITD